MDLSFALSSRSPGQGDIVRVTTALAGAAILYAIFWPIVAVDVVTYNIPWLQRIATLGPIAALGEPFGQYTPPYYYMLALASPLVGHLSDADIVKLVSLAGTLWLAVAVWRLAIALRLPHPILTASLSLLLPGVVLNTALMAQSDALPTAAVVLALAAAVDRRGAAMFAWCGFAAAIKAQALFCAPFFLALAIAHRMPVRQWLCAPAATAILFAPALACGWPPADLATVYLRQTDYFTELSRNAPNIWAIAQAYPIALPLTGLATAAAVGASAGYVAHVASRTFSDRALVAAAALAPLIVAGLLPRMHERYFYAADVLVFVWAAATQRSADRWTAVMVQAGSLAGIVAYATGRGTFAILGAVVMIIATWRLARPLILRAANDDGPRVPYASLRLAPPAG